MPNLHSLSHKQRVELFGQVDFVSAPKDTNPEYVRIPVDWTLSHMREVMIPQLAPLGVRHSVTFHYKTARRVRELWAEWQRLGLLDAVDAWNGSWVTRFKRQDGTVAERKAKCRKLDASALSNHAWGTAFDINAAAMPLGTKLVDVPKSFRELVPVAESYGFAWGGYFSRPDPMHYEDVKGIV